MQNNPKYNSILKTGKELFWKHGIKRVTVEEICREAGVSKMTYYKFFPNKIELAKTILDEQMDASFKEFDEIVNSDLAFSKKLKALFLMKINAVNIFSKEFIYDVYSSTDSGLKEYLESKAEDFKGHIVNFYKKAQKQGNIRKEVNIDFIMAYSTQMPELMKNEELMSQYKTPADFILEVMNLLFYGIVTGNE